LEENDLYVKPEKCTWKVQKVNFLGVIMDQGKIEIEKDNVIKQQLSWSICGDGLFYFFSIFFYYVIICSAWDTMTQKESAG